MSRTLLATVFTLVAAASAAAQEMPNAAQMSGLPLGAPELPNGTITVRVVREQMGNNVPNHPVKLIAANKTETGTTDAQGRAQFTGLDVGTVVYAETVVDGETLRSQEFDVPAKGGVRLALVAGVAAATARDRDAAAAAAKEPPRKGIVVFGGETRIILEFQDDNLNVFYLLDIVNQARTPIDTGAPLVIELPDGAAQPGMMQGSSTLATLQGDRVVITGPFPPGTTSVQIGYMMPYEGNRTTIVQRWPAPMEQVFVATEKVGEVHIESPQLGAHQEGDAGGTKFIMATGSRLNAGDPLTITLTGLPHHNLLYRRVGIGIGLLVLAAGLWAGITGTPARQGQAAALQARREKLFAELTELERQHRQGRIDQRRYESKRQTLVGQLERVLGELDRGAAA